MRVGSGLLLRKGVGRDGRDRRSRGREGRGPPNVWLTPHVPNPEKYPNQRCVQSAGGC